MATGLSSLIQTPPEATDYHTKQQHSLQQRLDAYRPVRPEDDTSELLRTVSKHYRQTEKSISPNPKRMLHYESDRFHFALEDTETESMDEYRVKVLPEFLGGYGFCRRAGKQPNIFHVTGRGELVDRITQDYKENIMLAREDLARLFSVSLLPLVETRT